MCVSVYACTYIMCRCVRVCGCVGVHGRVCLCKSVGVRAKYSYDWGKIYN
jgi:hypothetical protein